MGSLACPSPDQALSLHTGSTTRTLVGMSEARLSQVPAVTRAAMEAGHDPSVRRVGSRFVLVCTCGWQTPANMKRKTAYLAVAQHISDVGRAHLGERDTRSSSNSFPEAGGRA